MSFNPEAVRAGSIAKKQAEEFPTNQTRMAGPGGAFAMKMMNDPELMQRVAEWNHRFIKSNQGRDFNHSKIEMGVG